MSVPPNEIIYESEFRKDVHGLNARIQEKLAHLLDVFCENPFDPRLHTKPLGPPLNKIYSFRITQDYRVGFIFEASHVIRLLIADKRDQIYKRLERKIK